MESRFIEPKPIFTSVHFADLVAQTLDLRRRGRQSHPENHRYQAAIDRLEVISASVDEVCLSLEGQALLGRIDATIRAYNNAHAYNYAAEDHDWWSILFMWELREIGGFCPDRYGLEDDIDDDENELPRADTAILVLIGFLGEVETRYVEFIEDEFERKPEDDDDEDRR